METPPPDDLIPEHLRRPPPKQRRVHKPKKRPKVEPPPPPIFNMQFPADAQAEVGAVGVPVQELESEYSVATPRQRKVIDLRMLVSEKKRRDQESIKLYEPMPVQAAFHASGVKTRVCRGSNRGGKALTVDEPILTNNGFVPIGQVQVGDTVISGVGTPTKVIGVYPQGRKPVYRLTTLGGLTSRCCGEHLWNVGLRRTWNRLSLKEMMPYVGERGVPLLPILVPPAGRKYDVVKSIQEDGTAECVCIAVDHPSHTFVTRDYLVTHNTLPAAVEVARAVLNCDPHKKYPKYGEVYVVGYDYAHHGQTIYPKLFLSTPEAPQGPFKVIKDLKTQLLRAYRPWMPEDRERQDEATEAGPLIPQRFIEEISWEKKKENVPSMIRFKTGWTMWFFSGDGQPPRGAAIDLGWIDEEIKRPDWHSELVSRTADRNGLIIWSASPQTGTTQLFELHNQAEREKGDKDAVVEEFHVKLRDNQHLSAKSKHEIIANNLDELNRITRVEGDFIFSTKKIFSEYQALTHAVDLRHAPSTWARYAAIDPGHQICAVLFIAVPRPDEQEEFGEFVITDELYLQKCDAKKFATEFHGRVAGHVLEDWIIDAHGGRITDIGSGKSVIDQYRDALDALGCRNRRHGCGFTFGSDDIKARIEAARGYLRVQANGRPRCRIAAEVPKPGDHGQPVVCAPNWEWEMLRYSHKMVDGIVTDEPETRGRVHQMWTFTALCAYRPQWVEPVPLGIANPGHAYKSYQAKMRRQGGQQIGVMFGNPGRTE